MTEAYGLAAADLDTGGNAASYFEALTAQLAEAGVPGYVPEATGNLATKGEVKVDLGSTPQGA